jgi:hypothetical protein
VWQDLRAELHPKGLEVVTVALDTGGVDAAGSWIERAKPEHPALIDVEHRLDELFGVTNVPNGIWIDEGGMIVRPPEPAWPGKSMARDVLKGIKVPADADPWVVQALEMVGKIRADPERYVEALRDWVASGSASRFALSPEDVVARSRPRPREASEAAAHFELGQFLWRRGHSEDAMAHFAEARRLEPENWTYKRQAWSFVDPLQRPNDAYEGDWLSDVVALGPENYYPASPDMR